MPSVWIVCLANSRKHNGRCVAGLRLDGGGWVRPVSDHPQGVLFPWHFFTTSRREARVLDVLEIDLASHKPEPHQPENWLMADSPWRVLASPALENVIMLLRSRLTPGPGLFGDESDRIPFDRFLQSPAQSSLALVAPAGLRWRVRTGVRGNQQVRALFKLGAASYNLSVTDPDWEERLSRCPPGDYHPDELGLRAGDRVILTISLGEPFPVDNCCYKLVAAVIVLPRSPQS